MREVWRRTTCALITACVLIMPMRGLAQAPQPSAADGRSFFDTASIARVVDAELRLQAAMRGQGVAPTKTAGQRLRKGLLIGAAGGAVIGGVITAITPRCDAPDRPGGCGTTGSTGRAVVVGVIGGAVLGAGVGAVVAVLKK